MEWRTIENPIQKMIDIINNKTLLHPLLWRYIELSREWKCNNSCKLNWGFEIMKKRRTMSRNFIGFESMNCLFETIWNDELTLNFKVVNKPTIWIEPTRNPLQHWTRPMNSPIFSLQPSNLITIYNLFQLYIYLLSNFVCVLNIWLERWRWFWHHCSECIWNNLSTFICAAASAMQKTTRKEMRRERMRGNGNK